MYGCWCISWWSCYICANVNKMPFFVSVGDADIIDEAIYYFKANIFFRNYEIKVSVWFGSTYWQSLKTEPMSVMRLLVTEPHFFFY